MIVKFGILLRVNVAFSLLKNMKLFVASSAIENRGK